MKFAVCLTALAMFTEVNYPKLDYPKAPTTDQVDDYHGAKVGDPYRGLESADALPTQQWVKKENELTFGYLKSLPGREKIKTDLTKLFNYERFLRFSKVGSRYLYFHNSGLQNQNVLMVADTLNGPGRVLIDPNTYRKDGTVALNSLSSSWNGALLGYSVAQAGSDWSEWHVRDVVTGKDLPDVIQWTKSGGVSWTADDKSFYYSRYPEPAASELLTVAALDEKVYLHRLGTDQSDDTLIYQRTDQPTWSIWPQVMEGGRYLMLVTYSGVPGKNRLAFQDLRDPHPSTVDLVATDTGSYEPIAVIGSKLYLTTNEGAPRGRVMAVDMDHPEREQWKEVVPEKAETLNLAVIANGKMLLVYMKDAHTVAYLTSLDGGPLKEVALPGLGTARFSDASLTDKELFYSFEGFVAPPSIHGVDLATGKSFDVKRTKMSVDTSQFDAKQVFYMSKDGTKIPMFLTYRKGMKLDGTNPTLLYGYGGFAISETPSFSPANLEWLQMGGIFAQANLRGGSEYGDAWHQAGMREKKQNVFDDFIAAARYLISEKYTSTPKLAIYGRSNGGLLVGAVLNQTPELFGAAMPAVGVMDMFRFQKFGFGTQWVGEYGSADNASDFEYLKTYSPIHNIKKGGVYPPTLITTADHDDRVMPGHSLKYAATLQQAQEGKAPILIRIETRAGHGAGTPTSKAIDEWTDRFAFLRANLGMN